MPPVAPDERLKRAEAALLEQHKHGYVDDEALHREMTTVRRQLAALPSSDDKLVLFDRYRAEVRGFDETLDAASPEKLRELVVLLADRVRRQTGKSLGSSGPPRPGRSSSPAPRMPPRGLRGAWRPRTEPGTQDPTQGDPLDWHVAG